MSDENTPHKGKARANKAKVNVKARAKSKPATQRKDVVLRAASPDELEGRLFQIQRDWKSLSNFTSAMVWAWTSGALPHNVALDLHRQWHNDSASSGQEGIETLRIGIPKTFSSSRARESAAARKLLHALRGAKEPLEGGNDLRSDEGMDKIREALGMTQEEIDETLDVLEGLNELDDELDDDLDSTPKLDPYSESEDLNNGRLKASTEPEEPTEPVDTEDSEGSPEETDLQSAEDKELLRQLSELSHEGIL